MNKEYDTGLTILIVIGLIILVCLWFSLGRAYAHNRIEKFCNTENVFVLNGAAYVCVPCEGCKDNKDKKEK